MRALVIIIACSSILLCQSSAQQQNARLGVIFQGGLDQHLTAFSRIPEAENCCPEFTGGLGRVFGIGAQYINTITPSFGLDIRVGYQSANVDLSTIESRFIMNNGSLETATIRHDLSTTSAMLALDALGRFSLNEKLHALGGITVGYNLSGSYSQSEVFVTPGNATFENGQRTRNQRESSLSSLSSLYLGVTGGLSYDIPVNADRTTFVSPEILLTLSPTNHLDNTSWLIQRLRAGVAVSIIPPSADDDLSPVELFDIARTRPVRPGSEAISVPVPSISAYGLTDDGQSSAVSSIRVEEFASNRIRPLLPYVFFDQGSYTLASRYRQINREQTEGYSLENFYNLDAMVTYYQGLNIIGKRLSERPDASITLTGCRDASESGFSEDLAKRRAMVIKSYLVDTWSVDPARIIIEDRALPLNASSTDSPDGSAENRRVEITSADPVILSPVGSKDTMRVFTPAGIRFSPSVVNNASVKTWTLFVSQQEQIIKASSGDVQPPASIDWRIAESARFIPRGVRNLEYMLVVQDSNGAIIPSESKTLQVSEVTMTDKAKMGGTDKTVDRYSLILFGFDRADISTENQRLIEEVRKNVSSRSTVKVVGYSDRVGDAAYNLALSEKRAKAVATALANERVSTTGLGETLPLYDNDTPEGRFYSRTVEIIVETPR